MNNPFSDRGFTLAAAWTFNQLAYAIVYPFIPLYLCEERNLSIQTVSLIFPLMGLATILTPPVAGVLTDRLGRNFMMNFGQAARGGVFLILAAMVFFDAPFWLFAAMLMLNTAVGSAFQIGADAYLADITTEAERPGYYGKIRIGYNIGWALGPMLGAFFAKTPFWFFFLLTAFLCFGGTIFTKCTCRAPERIKENSPDSLTNRKKQNISPSQSSIFSELFANYCFLLLLTGSFLLYLLASQLYSTFSIYASNTIKISREALGTIFSLNGFIVIVLQLPLTALLTRFKVRLQLQLVLGALLYATGYFAIGGCHGAWGLAGAVFIVTIGEIIVQPALYTSIARETNPENAGRLFSAYSLMRGIGYAVGPWIGAQLYAEIASSQVMWGVLSMFALCAAVVFVIPFGTRRVYAQ